MLTLTCTGMHSDLFEKISCRRCQVIQRQAHMLLRCLMLEIVLLVLRMLVGGGLKPIDTGGLKVVQKRIPEIANNEWFARGYDKLPYAPVFEVRVVLAGNEEYVRVFSYNSDGTSNKLGGWTMRKSDIEGLTPTQIADKYALPQEPTHICDVIVDPDFHLQAGIANKVKGWGRGERLQFDTMGKKLPPSAFVNERIIGE